MATKKASANSKARKYYKEHPEYRKEKIEDRKDYYHENQKDQNAYAREYYRENLEYKKYKQKYARDYKKAHRKSS